MMIIEPTDALRLSAPQFEGMLEDVEKALQGTLSAMLRKDMDAGSVSLKIELKIERRLHEGAEGEPPRLTRHPDFSYRIGARMSSKADWKARAVTPDDGVLELDDSGAVCLVDAPTGQIGMFDAQLEPGR